DRSDQAVNYSHPVVAKGSQGDEIVVGGTGMLIGYDPDNGKRLWHARTLLRNIKTTPVSFGDRIYVSLQSGGIANQWLQSADAKGAEVGRGGNGDGKLSKAEMQAMVGKRKIPESFFKKTFDKGDLNKDGVLEGIELDKAFLSEDNFAGARFDTPSEKAGDQSIHAVRAGGRGDVTKTHVLWMHNPSQIDHIVSPLVVDGRMLLVKGGGIATGFEIAGGKKLWGPKRINNTCEYFASPIYADGKIYIAGENGYMVVLKSSDKLEILAKNDMGEPIVGTPAIADGRMIVRTRGHLYCVGLKK
ncbi:MAG TPA: serine/threonine protein kinase, partial [Planctomycetaceae bacterium]|nr:serine/threonine protein kinase [Planctomycetaceae bacterium]